ncbi:hypothetical protein H311_00608 [Anncaliia algerae PRA109]|nr:hypothetical protein H311_00608 [Anncaliia algerae PRA109]
MPTNLSCIKSVTGIKLISFLKIIFIAISPSLESPLLISIGVLATYHIGINIMDCIVTLNPLNKEPFLKEKYFYKKYNVYACTYMHDHKFFFCRLQNSSYIHS